MQILINGETTQLPSAFSVSELIAHLELENKRIAVEINEQIIPKAEHPTRLLAEGDRIEIVHAIGGG